MNKIILSDGICIKIDFELAAKNHTGGRDRCIIFAFIKKKTYL